MRSLHFSSRLRTLWVSSVIVAALTVSAHAGGLLVVIDHASYAALTPAQKTAISTAYGSGRTVITTKAGEVWTNVTGRIYTVLYAAGDAWSLKTGGWKTNNLGNVTGPSADAVTWEWTNDPETALSKRKLYRVVVDEK